MSAELQALGRLFRAIFRMWDTPIVLPWIGQTSFFKMSIFLAVMIIVVGFVRQMIGGRD